MYKYKLYLLKEENVHNCCHIGLIFWTSWRVDFTKIKIFVVIRCFEKWVQKYRILRKNLNGKLYRKLG